MLLERVGGEVITVPWIIVFVFSWIIFLLFVDFSRLNKTFYGGLITLTLGILVDWAGHRLNLYRFDGTGISWLGSSLYYSLGPLLTMGILFFQYISLNRRLQAENIIAFTLAYFSTELLIVGAGAANYINWHPIASLGIDLLVFTALTYLGEIIVYGNTIKKVP
ncbi:MAG: hypothetical protein ACYDEQ_15460 [Desulfocucumaceae bacterium]